MARDDGRDADWKAFREAVNMSADELGRWLETVESRSVGQKAEAGAESTGHASGRRIVAMLEKGRDGWTEADWAHAAKVVGYVHRHLAQRPEGDVSGTRWAFSLMNWGHRPDGVKQAA